MLLNFRLRLIPSETEIFFVRFTYASSNLFKPLQMIHHIHLRNESRHSHGNWLHRLPKDRMHCRLPTGCFVTAMSTTFRSTKIEDSFPRRDCCSIDWSAVMPCTHCSIKCKCTSINIFFISKCGLKAATNIQSQAKMWKAATNIQSQIKTLT